MQETQPRDTLIAEFIEKHKLPESFRSTALEWFIPLASTIIAHHVGANKPLILGLNGCQGSGKSTLSDFLKDYLSQMHELEVIALSLDDFYYSQEKRNQLAEQVHPLLKTRGVPGTHDTEMLNHVLESLKNNALPIKIPRFNKATDNPIPSNEWKTQIKSVDIVIMEGWCWGVTAQNENALITPINDLEAQEDPSGKWRGFVNTSLSTQYQRLYEYMDFWIMLRAPSFNSVLGWRQEQERKLIASLQGQVSAAKGTMSPAEIERFIAHYQRLTEHGLQTLPARCDSVLQLDENRIISNNSLTNKQPLK